MGRSIPVEVKQKYLGLRRSGFSQAQAMRETGIKSTTTAHALDQALPVGTTTKSLVEQTSNPPRSFDELSDLGKRALESFETFGTEFFGLRVAPWWRVAAEQIVGYVLDPEEQLVLLNGPSDSGKTTMIETLLCWLLSGGGSCDPEKGRALRTMFGSATFNKSVMSVNRIRKILESSRPYGDAEHSLSEIYGRFKSVPGEGDPSAVWQDSQFTVAQVGERERFQKDPSLQAASMKALPLSSKVDVAVWDDPARESDVEPEEIAEKFGAVAESRIMQGGTLLVVAQRLGAGDIYGQLASRTWADDDGEQHPTYHHLVFKAHYEERCDGKEHVEWDGKDTGCLLDSVRLPWKRLLAKANTPNYNAMYLQDVESSSSLGLIEKAWLDGNVRDSDGFISPGNWDRDREFWNIVVNADGKPFPTYLAIDPAQSDPRGHSGSASWWAFELWQVDPKTKVRYLIYGERGRFDIRQVLDDKDGRFTGVFYDIVFKAANLGARPTAVVIEENAARHWIQSPTFQLWHRIWPGVLVEPFHTARNRDDPAIGLASLLKAAYRNGESRLPGRGVDSRNYLKVKVEELTHIRPRSDDTLFAEWIGLASLDKILSHGQGRQGGIPVVRYGGRYHGGEEEEPVAMYESTINGVPTYRPHAEMPQRRPRAPLGRPLGHFIPDVARTAGLAVPLERDPDRRDDGT